MRQEQEEAEAYSGSASRRDFSSQRRAENYLCRETFMLCPFTLSNALLRDTVLISKPLARCLFDFRIKVEPTDEHSKGASGTSNEACVWAHSPDFIIKRLV